MSPIHFSDSIIPNLFSRSGVHRMQAQQNGKNNNWIKGERKINQKNQKASLDGVTCPVLFTGVWSSGESQKTQSQTAGGRHLGKKNKSGGMRVGVVEEEEEGGGRFQFGKVAIMWTLRKEAPFLTGRMTPTSLLHGFYCTIIIVNCLLFINWYKSIGPVTTITYLMGA